MKIPEGKIMEQLRLQKSWWQIRHILSDYLLHPVQTLLFDKVAKYPNQIGHKDYVKVWQQTKDASCPERQQEAKCRKEEMNRRWSACFPELLVEFGYLRLVGTQKDMDAYRHRAVVYGTLFLNLIGDGDAGNSFADVTCGYFAMLQDYLLRNTPHLPGGASNLSVRELLKTVRSAYVRTARVRGYVPFEDNLYPAGILRLLDDVAEAWQTNPVCRYPLITPEYLFGFFIYIYMVEFLIHADNLSRGDSAGQSGERMLKHNLIDYLQTLDLEKRL
ncbi:MAG TPA: hypothetical protein H9922_10300 [Candidatus Phocaeicola caecigallinarum]|nr:hypothetical protein [Candidatus Phocaeicola caecigallinarum]